MSQSLTPLSIHPALPEELAPGSMARQLYLSAFPECERRDADIWAEYHKEKKDFCVYIIRRGEKFSGILTAWKLVHFIYIEHFAIQENERGSGTGSLALSQFIGQNSLPIVLEVELPLTAQAVRRIAFYERLGLSVCEKPYLQPPYRDGDDEFPLLLMSTDSLRLDTHFEEVKQAIYRNVYGMVHKDADGK